MQILETERLVLREFTLDDAENLYALNLDYEVIKFTGDLPFKSIEETRFFLLNYDQYMRYGTGRWAVIRKIDSRFIGWCGIKYHPNRNYYDLGFRFYQEFWNKGYATEAAKACIRYAFEQTDITFLVARAMKENAASVQVLKKIGFQYHSTFDFDGQPGVFYKIHKN